MHKLKHWPKDERPQEKLLRYGAAALTDAEVLAIILRTGIRGCNVVDLSRAILQQTGGLRQLLQLPASDFRAIRGLGQAKYVQLQAIMEVARRVYEQKLKRRSVLSCSDDARKLLQSLLMDKPHEQFVVLYLDNQHQVLRHEVLFTGTVNSASVYPRVVVEKVLHERASAVLVAHNHPSGIAEPSQADQQITTKLKMALALIDVALLDHMIVGNGNVVSMAERGML